MTKQLLLWWITLVSHQRRHKQSTAISMWDTRLRVKWNKITMRWEIRVRLVDGVTNAQNEREKWKSVQETLLLPKSIGDSQPRDRRLPASSLHSATTGKKRRAELIDKTCGGHKEEWKQRLGWGNSLLFKSKATKGTDCVYFQFCFRFACTIKHKAVRRKACKNVIYEHRKTAWLKALQDKWRDRVTKVSLEWQVCPPKDCVLNWLREEG